MPKNSKVAKVCLNAANGDPLLALDYACDVVKAREPGRVARMRRHLIGQGDLVPAKKPHAEHFKDRTITDKARRLMIELSHGRTLKDAAYLLAISPESAQDHISHARAILKAKNTTHAVAIATRRRLL